MTTQRSAGSVPMRGYPGPGLKDQVRAIEETLSAFQVMRDHFFPHLKPTAEAKQVSAEHTHPTGGA